MGRKHHTKLAELILYISDRHETDELFGSVRLAKTLFYADFLYYAKHGRSITEERYIRMKNGPVPDALLETRDRLQHKGELVMKERFVRGYKQKRPIAIREPDLSEFSAEEIAMVDYVLSKLEGQTATAVSELSHRFEAWQLAADGEEIPYQTAFISEREPSAEDYAFARELLTTVRQELAPEPA
ncbi:MAG: SocA family protein [Gemmatimonadetes bacterium]|nr:SocA family protein [Gemmatimonadota bacterium]